MKTQDLSLLAAKILALAVILMLINGQASLLLPGVPAAGSAGESAAAPAPPSGSFMALVAAVMLLQTIALAYPIVRSRWHGWRLALAVFVLYFGTVTFLSQIESLVYLDGKMPEGMLPALFAMGLVTAFVFSPLAVLVLGRWRRKSVPGPRQRFRLPESAAEWWCKAAIGGLVFVALYYLFGYYVAWQNPELRAYYGGEDPGSFLAQMRGIVVATPWMLPFQFVRGLAWVGLAVLVLRIMGGHRWEGGLAVALLFTVPVVYLLFPNPMMPDEIRLTHLVETAPYQFLFGWFIVWLLARARRDKLEPKVA
jgi:hypothetical protein